MKRSCVHAIQIPFNLRFLRRSCGWTQAHLAKASGISLTTISRAENGLPVTEETLMNLAEGLRVTRKLLWENLQKRPVDRASRWAPYVTRVIPWLMGLRRKGRYSQHRLSRTSGVSAKTIQRAERGEAIKEILITRLEKILKSKEETR